MQKRRIIALFRLYHGADAASATSRPLFLLLLVTGLFTFLIQSGELGTSDTTHRLQVTHSLWTGQPQVFPSEYPEFGLHGRGGRLYAWYGIGQSLLMLPADLIGSAASHLPFWREYVDSQADPAIRSIVVSVSTNILVNVLTALAAFRLLALLGFSEGESVAGTLALLCATTHLHLRAEHAGEQLCSAADDHRLRTAIQVAEDRGPARAVLGFGGAGAESADAAYHHAGPFRSRLLHPARRDICQA